mmetsp:Transcript_145007/g.255612  ORF Transcript_145007/g.255612 Transcript_145007/m.255612 type:complete len:348 (+) Transcript_145007:86-1129(+)
MCVSTDMAAAPSATLEHEKVESECPQRCCIVRLEDVSSCSSRQDVEDAFDAPGVSTELLKEWARLEQQALEPTGRPSTQMSSQVRDTTHRFLQHLTHFAGLGMETWFEIVTLLDVYLLKAKDGNAISSLPSTCAALVMLAKKNDCSIVEVGASKFVPHVAQMARFLQKQGIAGVDSDITEERLLCAEEEVLEALGWRLFYPTVESWTSMFCTRFNILTENEFQGSVSWIWQRSLIILRLILTKQSLSIEVPPQTIAAGVVGLGMLAAKLLPGEALRPPRISSADWANLYIEGPSQGEMPECVPGMDAGRHLFDAIEIAMGCALSQVQEACFLTATVIRDALADKHAV